MCTDLEKHLLKSVLIIYQHIKIMRIKADYVGIDKKLTFSEGGFIFHKHSN